MYEHSDFPPVPPSLVWARLRQLASRRGLPASECEDVVQEAWLALLKEQPARTLDEPRTRAWLRGVVRNKAGEFLRRRARSPVRQLIGEPLAINGISCPNTLGPDENRPPPETRPKLEAALNRLSEENREIVLKRALEGLSFREIGLSVGLKPSQAKEHYYRALRKLREWMRLNPPNEDCVIEGGGVEIRVTGSWKPTGHAIEV